MNANVSEAVANVQEAVAEQVSEVRAEALEDAATRVEAAERAARAPAPTVIMDNSSIQQPRSLPPADQLPPAQLPPENADADGPEKTAAQTPARKRRLL
jgi:hypothetical protein